MNQIEFGDNRETMKRLAADGVKVQMCVTSPPYYGLRDYGTGQWSGGKADCDHIEHHAVHGGQRADRDQTSQIFQYKNVCGKCGATREDQQLGQEDTPEEFIENLVDVFRHVREILADDGVIWVNIGDSYNGSGKGAMADGSVVGGGKQATNKGTQIGNFKKTEVDGLKPKDLIGIPWMLAFALRADGWFLRQDIIWHKPNPMPESVTDRCVKAHEYIFLLSKKRNYYFDHTAIKEPAVTANSGKTWDERKESGEPMRQGLLGAKGAGSGGYATAETRNKRSVWTVNTKPYKGAHFAVYPESLIEPCILAGSKFGDIVFDPFMGSGTTAAVAIKNGRQYLGCELNPEYGPLQQQRIAEAHEQKSPIIQGDPTSLFTFE